MRPTREGPLGQYPATLIFFGINLLFLIRTMGGTDRATLVEAGAVRADLLWSGEFWRLLTAGFVHVGVGHFFMNMLGLVFLGRIAEHLLGSVWYALLYVLSGLLGFAMSQTFHPVWVLTAGASASGFGIVGMMLGSEMRRGRRVLEVFQTPFGRLLLLYVVFSFVWGLMSYGIDNYAHAGGFLGGFLGAYFLMPSPWETESRRRTWTRIFLVVLMIEALIYPNLPVPNAAYHLYSGVDRLQSHRYEPVEDRLSLAESLEPSSARVVDFYRGLLLSKHQDFAEAQAVLAPYFVGRPVPYLEELPAYLRWRYAGARSGRAPLRATDWGNLAGLASRLPERPDRRRAFTHLTWMAILLEDREQMRRLAEALEEDGSSAYYARGTLGGCHVLLGDAARGEEELRDALRDVRDSLADRSHLALDIVLERPPFLFLSDLEALYTALIALARHVQGEPQEAERLLDRALEIDPLCEVVPVVRERMKL